MSILGDGDINDLLHGDLGNDKDELPEDGDDDQLFGNSEKVLAENQDVAAVKVQPKKRNVLNPRPRLNVEVLRGKRGLHTLEDYFKDIKYKGKGKEKEDLDEILCRIQHWGHRMYPTYKFEDVLSNVERLGKKKPLQVHMSRYRLGMLESMNNHAEINDEDDDVEQTGPVEEPFDEFDALLDEQIAISKVDSRTPGSSHSKHLLVSANTSLSTSNFTTPSFSKGTAIVSTPYSEKWNLNDTSDLAVPLPPTQPSTPVHKQLSDEQKARIAENRRLAQERLANKKKLQ